MFSTLGVTLTAAAVLLSSLVTWILCRFSTARRASRASALASASTREEKAPPMWESRLADLAAEVASLSSSFEKVTRELTRLNQRHAMRALRADRKDEAPPLGASKAELRQYYGIAGLSGPQQATLQQSRE